MNGKKMTLRYPGGRHTLTIKGDAIASGGDGTIYHLAGYKKPLVAKLYHEPAKDPVRPRKLQAMLENRPNLPAVDLNGKQYVQIAWPEGILEINGVFKGFAMPLVDLQHSTTLENLLSVKTRKAYGLPEHYAYRVTAAANLARMVAELHAHRHFIVDLKPVNLNVYSDTLFISVLDCDGFSIGGLGSERFAAHQYTPDYIAPEIYRVQKHPQDCGVEQDRFALAVIIFRLLNRGLHPYQGVPGKAANLPPTNQERIGLGLYAYGRKEHARLKPSPWSIHESFPADIRKLFDQAFTREQGRPSAEDWANTLRPYTLMERGLLKQCSQHADHAHFGNECPLCDIQGQRKTVEKQQRKQRRRKPGRNRQQRRRQTHQARTQQPVTVIQTPQGPIYIQGQINLPGGGTLHTGQAATARQPQQGNLPPARTQLHTVNLLPVWLTQPLQVFKRGIAQMARFARSAFQSLRRGLSSLSRKQKISLQAVTLLLVAIGVFSQTAYWAKQRQLRAESRYEDYLEQSPTEQGASGADSQLTAVGDRTTTDNTTGKAKPGLISPPAEDNADSAQSPTQTTAQSPAQSPDNIQQTRQPADNRNPGSATAQAIIRNLLGRQAMGYRADVSKLESALQGIERLDWPVDKASCCHGGSRALKDGSRFEFKMVPHQVQLPMHLAVSSSFTEAVDLFLKIDDRLDYPDADGSFPLHVAVMHAELPIIRKLLEAGAPVNLQDAHGRTAIMYLVMEEEAERARGIYDLMMQYGLKIAVKDNAGRTLYQYAQLQQESDSLKFLVRPAFAP